MESEAAFDLLTLVGLRLADAMSRGCAAMGLTETEARVIACLAMHGPSRPGAVGPLVGASARRMTQLIDSLASKGYVDRQVDPADARARILILTNSGDRLAQQIAALRAAWSEDLFRGVPAKDVATVAATLAAVLGRLEA